MIGSARQAPGISIPQVAVTVVFALGRRAVDAKILALGALIDVLIAITRFANRGGPTLAMQPIDIMITRIGIEIVFVVVVPDAVSDGDIVTIVSALVVAIAGDIDPLFTVVMHDAVEHPSIPARA